MRSRTAGGGVKWGVAASDVLPAWVADMDLGIPPARRRAVSTGSRGDAGVTPGVCHARAGTDPRHSHREVDVPTLPSAESHHSSFSDSGTATRLVAARAMSTTARQPASNLRANAGSACSIGRRSTSSARRSYSVGSALMMITRAPARAATLVRLAAGCTVSAVSYTHLRAHE